MCLQKHICTNKGFDHNDQPFMLHDQCHLTQTFDHTAPFTSQVVLASGFGFVIEQVSYG